MILVGSTAGAGQGPEPPAGLKDVTVAGEPLTLWPYTTSDYENPSDPINLIFPNADPRAIRQALLKLDGSRTGVPPLPGVGCTWTDAMGYEQAAYAEPAGYVAGAVQLACVAPDAPLGSPFRFHVRLFRSGSHTIGNAHYELLVPGTADHRVLSWDAARDFVTFDVFRTGLLTSAPSSVALVPPPSFRTLERLVYGAIAGMPGGPTLLAGLGLVLPPSGDVPIPTSGAAAVFAGSFALERARTRATTTTRVDYSIIAPKPFCATGPYDFVKLEGPVDFSMTVETHASGRYERRLVVGGTLEVTPMRPLPTSPPTFEPVGDPVEGLVFEHHNATLGDRGGQVRERAAQLLLGEPPQSLRWRFSAGLHDRFARELLCGE